jgi:uncharacterized protein YegP (UPF0339 family)
MTTRPGLVGSEREVAEMAAKSAGYFEVTSKGQSGWQWELTAEVGQTIATSSLVPERDAALKTLKWLRTHNIEKCPILNAEGKPIV